ncbi:hypothetical protein MLD38_039553 [Melastoma candidum]|uniref:Uncharacterized protein n=1 Tax=Melastoma candidum TaxID=119954 RepID=A0ACB9L3C0_9MYRT|nr:hypothetical protein MLD38_039553 [Melastoma candidum]
MPSNLRPIKTLLSDCVGNFLTPEEANFLIPRYPSGDFLNPQNPPQAPIKMFSLSPLGSKSTHRGKPRIPNHQSKHQPIPPGGKDKPKNPKIPARTRKKHRRKPHRSEKTRKQAPLVVVVVGGGVHSDRTLK